MQQTLSREPRAAARPAVKTTPDWGAAGWAGLAAGLVFLGVELALRPYFGDGGWMPSRLVAAVALGRDVLEPPPEYAALIQTAALGVHFTLSLLYARLLALLMYRRPMRRALGIGAVFGLGLYFLNFYALSLPFPWIEQARGWITLLSHLSFGVTASLLYKVLERPEETV